MNGLAFADLNVIGDVAASSVRTAVITRFATSGIANFASARPADDRTRWFLARSLEEHGKWGKSSPLGKLSNGGASRWKQRALYDFIKDIAPLTIGIRMARISIWDRVIVSEMPVTVLAILKQEMYSAAEPLFTLIQQRSCEPRQETVS